MKMFRASMEYNMCLFSVVGSDRKLEITPQGQYEEQNLILGANQTHRVVQGQHRVQRWRPWKSMKPGARWPDILFGGAGDMQFYPTNKINLEFWVLVVL